MTGHYPAEPRPLRDQERAVSYTQGPWKADGCDVFGPGRTWVLETLDLSSPGKGEANARLAATAPELLEQLKEGIADWQHRAEGKCPLCRGLDEMEKLRYRASRALLAKALGEEPA